MKLPLCKFKAFNLGNPKTRAGVMVFATLLTSSLAHASVESSLLGLKTVLLGSILPVLAVIGLGFAGFSFFTGNPNAKQHLMYALIGCAVIFGAQAIVDMMARVVR
jgi:type IV secretory pathway VirB2 component (pilin)